MQPLQEVLHPLQEVLQPPQEALHHLQEVLRRLRAAVTPKIVRRLPAIHQERVLQQHRAAAIAVRATPQVLHLGVIAARRLLPPTAVAAQAAITAKAVRAAKTAEGVRAMTATKAV